MVAFGSFQYFVAYLTLSARSPVASSETFAIRCSGQAFAFLELKTMELATSVLELDGIVYKETQLKMRRPSDYNPQLVPAA